MDLDVELKSLAEELQLSDDLLLKFKVMVESYIQDKLEETNKQHKQEIEMIEEQHSEVIKSLQEEINFITEKAEEYGQMLQEKADEYGQFVAEETLEDASKYADYVVEKFIEEHSDKFIKESEYSKMKNVFESIKKSFETNMFILESAEPDEDSKSDESELNEAKEQYSKIFDELVEMKTKYNNLQKEILFEEKTKTLADTQKERVIALLESVNPKSLEEYGKSLDLIVSEIAKKQTTITEEIGHKETEVETKPVNDKISTYLKFL